MSSSSGPQEDVNQQLVQAFVEVPSLGQGVEVLRLRLQRLGLGAVDAVEGEFRRGRGLQGLLDLGQRVEVRRALGQAASGTIAVAEDHLCLEVALPWLLAKLSERFVPTIRKEGTLLLEKK